jgi:hypothetical protein
LAVDEQRGFSSPRAQTELENDLPAATVAPCSPRSSATVALAALELVKAALLGVGVLTVGDEHAPVPGLPALDYGEALAAIAEAFGAVSPELGELVVELDRTGHIDALPPARKRSPGDVRQRRRRHTAICGGGVHRAARRRADACARDRTHALHYALAAGAQTSLDYDPTTPIAETAAAYAARAAGEVLTAPRLTELWLDAGRWLHSFLHRS